MHFLREMCVCSRLLLISVLFWTPGTNASCLENFPEANSSNVVAMCTDSTVTGHHVYIDTSQSLSLPLQPGSICTCTAHTGDSTFNVSVGYTGPSIPSCRNYIEFNSNSTSNKVTCQTDNLGTLFSDISNVSVDYHTVSSNANGEYCVKLQSKCTADEFQCTDGTCISLANICDVFPDCRDRSDEADDLCGSPLCNEGQVLCADQLQCIDESQRCNGNFECNDHSDENCVNGSYVPANVTASKFDSTITITCSKVVEPITTTAAPTSSTPSTTVPTTSTPSTAAPTTLTPSTATPTSSTPSTAVPTNSTPSTATPTTSTTSTPALSSKPTPTTSTISSSPSLTSSTPPIVSSTEPGDNTNIGLIVGIVVAVLVVIALIIGGVVFYRKYYHNVKKYLVEKMHKENNVSHYENPTGKPARARNGDVIVPEHEYDEIKLDSI